MRYLIISDIHSNLEALLAVFGDAERRGFDACLCLGDFVGYAADPDRCVETIASRDATRSVLGNHDAAVIDPSERGLFNQFARAGIIYSEENISQQSRQYLEALPLTIEDNSFLAVHSSPHSPSAWIYVIEPYDASDAFAAMTRNIAFIGHTHYPAIHFEDGTVRSFVPGMRGVLDGQSKMLVNVGSVGQPRDGDPRAAYVLFDDEALSVEIHRVEYDIDTTAQKILDAGLPEMLAERIRRGY